jgi:ATP-dependent exoDNAse (exonuclease V) beta subunit
VRDELARSRCDIHELAAQLARWIAGVGDDLPDDRDVQRAETDADAIRISTIHKAKGLEAPFVFLYGGATGGRRGEVHTVRDADGRHFVIKRDRDDPIATRIDDATLAENQRLAYVALTRAQIRLYLPCYPEGTIRDEAMYQPIQRCLAPLVASGDAAFERVAVAIDAPPPLAAPIDALADLVVTPAPQLADLAALAPERAGLVVTSYTRLAHSDLDSRDAPVRVEVADAIDRGELDGEREAYADAAGDLGLDDLPPGADSGSMVHDVLEVVDLVHVRRAPSFAAWSGDPEVRAQLADAARARHRRSLRAARRAHRSRRARRAARARRWHDAAAAGRSALSRARGRVRVPAAAGDR